MNSDSRAPWQPHRSWADPLIMLLALLALLAAGLALRVRGQAIRRPSEQASLQGRMLEVALAGPSLLGRETGGQGWVKAGAQLREPWDQALLAVLQAEQEARKPETNPVPELQATPAGSAGEGFRRAYEAAYAGGPLPDPAVRQDLHRRLGGGYAADLLEARLQDREGGGEALRLRARSALGARFAGLGALGFLVLTLAAGGLGLGIYLLATSDRKPDRPLPEWGLSGRAVALVMLTWFLAYFVSGNAVGLLLHPWPGLRWLVPAFTYLLHAGFGLLLLCRAEGLGPAALWRRVAPGRPGRDLAWGAGFLALAVLLVLVAALLSSLILRPDQNPQRELQELVRGLGGWGPNLVLFANVALVAPRLEAPRVRRLRLPVPARRPPMALALALSALLFGAIHLQPAGLPVLSTLGLAMGLAMRHTGSLRTPILVHGAWNGGLFLLMRAFA